MDYRTDGRAVATDEQIAWFEAKRWVYRRSLYAYHSFSRRGFVLESCEIVGARGYWLVRKNNPSEVMPLKFKCPIEAYQWAVLEGLIDN